MAKEAKDLKKEEIPDMVTVKAPRIFPTLITFDKWFLGTKRKITHKNGIKAFCNTVVNRTREAWDELFKNY